MKSLARGTLLLACAMAPLVVACNGESDSGTHSVGGRSGSSGTDAIVGETPCLRACSNFARFCGDPFCSAVCAGIEAVYDEPLCATEAKAQFDCITTLQAADFDCGLDAGELSGKAVEALMSRSQTGKCAAQFTEHAQCRRTGGADCAPEPAFDESCSIADDVHTHFQYCKVDVPMPAGCVPYTSAAASVGWYCCE